MIKIVQKEFYSFVKRESKNAISRKIIKTVMSAKKLKKILAEHLKPTDSIEVHTSLSAFGYIPGGEQSVVKVLKEVVNQGNIIMAAQTADIGDPIDWEDPPATPEAEKEIIENMPAYDKETTPIHYIGKTPEYFRTSKDVKRSDHPLYSMCAWGKRCR
ncbi:AAC(3) family N-acetyltransferase [Lactobacillus helveticus]|nr:AAC(3) family N-acetyltransferase [Lactobacillus helveticus]